MRKLVLVGGGGTGADVLAVIGAMNLAQQRYEVIGLLDDALPPGSLRWGVPVLGGLADAPADRETGLVNCLGSPRSFRGREALFTRLGFDLERFETLIHPSAIVGPGASVGVGSIIYPNVVLLSGVTVGRHVQILSGCVLNHEVEVGDWSILASGAMISGAVRIGRGCYLGAASSVREGIHVGDGALLAMGSAAVRDVAPGDTVGGVPARPLQRPS